MTNDLPNNRALCKPAPRNFPYRSHRNMHEVMLSEFLRRDQSQFCYFTFDQWCQHG